MSTKCIHNKQKSYCLDCGGGSICQHKKRRERCRDCNGSQFCEHDKIQSQCAKCHSCEHGKLKTVCKECKILGIGGGSLCEHFVKRNNCSICTPCLHGRTKTKCKACSPCPHGSNKNYCKQCLEARGSASVCSHGIMKGGCRSCNPTGFYRSYVNRAKVKGLEFFLSFEEFKELINQPCKYCGSIDSIGVDRQNSTIGYNKENSVPCCSICNYMKLDRSEEVFLSHVDRVASHQRGLKVERSGRESRSTH
jgi:hypothetical protein